MGLYVAGSTLLSASLVQNTQGLELLQKSINLIKGSYTFPQRLQTCWPPFMSIQAVWLGAECMM